MIIVVKLTAVLHIVNVCECRRRVNRSRTDVRYRGVTVVVSNFRNMCLLTNTVGEPVRL